MPFLRSTEKLNNFFRKKAPRVSGKRPRIPKKSNYNSKPQESVHFCHFWEVQKHEINFFKKKAPRASGKRPRAILMPFLESTEKLNNFF